MGSPNVRERSRPAVATAAEDPAPAGSRMEVATPEVVRSKKKSRKGGYIRRRLGCCGHSAAGDEREATGGGLPEEAGVGGVRSGRVPTHLVITVNGIIGSAGDWRFAAKQFGKKLPEDVLVHCSRCNCNMLTFDGVDVMGERLAKEVLEVVQCTPGLQRISFVGHSLGGLIARYAIAKLYEPIPTKETCNGNGYCKGLDTRILEERSKGKIAGLEPMNFITFATPHLGSRWHRQVPLFCGFHLLENMASHGSWILGRTGKHLFLKDNDEGKHPLLLRMVRNSEDLHFISALQSFRRCVAYSNVCSDHIVGWKTSSIRRQHELPKREEFTKNHKYPHIVHVETAEAVSLGKGISMDLNGRTFDMQEAMIDGLNKVVWERVDVSFRKSKQRFFAHNTIQVKTPYINSDGADVIFHMIDNFAL